MKDRESYLSQADPSQVECDSIVLARVSNIASGTTRFRVMNPDSRIRLKITVAMCFDQNAQSNILTMPTTLYLGEEEQIKKNGKRILCTDILRDSAGNVIHQSAPLTIPEDQGLNGFTTEFVTSADSILGIFFTNSPAGTFVGHWIAQARWQPDGQRLCDEDWAAVRRKCRIVLVGDPLPGGGG